MKKITIVILLVLVSGALLKSMNKASTSSSSSTPQTATTNPPAPTVESHLIKIPMTLEKPANAPDGVIKDDTLYLNINNQVPVIGGSFADHITEQLAEHKPVILAVATTKVNGIYNYHIYEAATTKWFYGNHFSRNRYSIPPDQFPSEPTNRQPVINRVLFFILYDKNKPVEYIGSDYDLFQGKDDQKTIIRNTLFANEGNAQAILNLGFMYFEQEKLGIAEQYLLQSAKAGNAKAINNLGVLYTLQKKPALAEQYLKQAVDKEFADAVVNLAIFYEAQNKPELAQQYFNQAEELYKKAAARGNIHALLSLGILYEKQNKLDLAERYLRQVADLGSPDAMNRLAALYKQLKKYDLAERYYKQAADDYEFLDAMVNLGALYREQNKLELAEQYYRQALQKVRLKANPKLETVINQQLADIAKMKAENK